MTDFFRRLGCASVNVCQFIRREYVKAGTFAEATLALFALTVVIAATCQQLEGPNLNPRVVIAGVMLILLALIISSAGARKNPPPS
jgi:hypothetical protein